MLLSLHVILGDGSLPIINSRAASCDTDPACYQHLMGFDVARTHSSTNPQNQSVSIVMPTLYWRACQERPTRRRRYAHSKATVNVHFDVHLLGFNAIRVNK